MKKIIKQFLDSDNTPAWKRPSWHTIIPVIIILSIIAYAIYAKFPLEQILYTKVNIYWVWVALIGPAVYITIGLYLVRFIDAPEESSINKLQDNTVMWRWDVEFTKESKFILRNPVGFCTEHNRLAQLERKGDNWVCRYCNNRLPKFAHDNDKIVKMTSIIESGIETMIEDHQTKQ